MQFKPIKSDCLKVRQTMFDFLKRKKHHQLQQSLKQFDSASKSQNKSMYQSASGKKSFYDEVIEEPSTIPLFSNRKGSIGKTITPKKITFGDQNEIQLKSARRPLVDMISASKNINRQRQKSANQHQKSSKKSLIYESSNPKSFVGSSTLEPFIKRKMQVSLGSISQKIRQILQAGKFAHEKNGQLSVALVNFVKDLAKDNTGMLEKKLGDVRYILNAMENALQKFSTPSFLKILQQIEEFGSSLTSHFHQLQSSTNANLREHYEKNLSKITVQKQQEINQLSQQEIRFEKEIERLNKLVERQQKRYDNEIENLQEKINDLCHKNDCMRMEFAQKEQNFSEKIQKLTQQLASQKQFSSNLEKQLKNTAYKHEEYLINQQEKRQEQLQARQAFLLDEIQSMKLTFNTDISQLHKLYESKSLSYEQKLSQLTKQLQEQRYKNKCDRQVSDKILAEANNSRKDACILRKKNQQVVKDLCKVNDQFFKHWLALKDVKTLAQRLNIFQYFERIYLDLAFDPLLFHQ